MTVVGSLLFASAGFAGAADELRLPGWFTDHMVLQRDKQIPIWGWAKTGDTVKVQLGDETQTANADATGRWQVSFAPRPVGGPFVLSAETGSKIAVSDILIGDVWLIGGQSNMEIPVKHGTGADESIKTSRDDRLRLIHIKECPSYVPQADVEGQWLPATPEAVPMFSCVGYAFGRKLREEMKDVPIGLIQAPVGSTVAETWLSRAELEQNTAFAHYAKDLDTTAARFPVLGKKTKELDPRKVPTVMYNGMIHPLVPYAIRGVIWWQGLANSNPVERAFEYRQLFPYLIQCWRKEWGQGDFPFIFAEEPTLKWAYHKPGFMVIREAQLMTAQKVPNTAVIVNSDLRNDADPELKHFPQKPPVGQRMALAALAIEYSRPVVYCGPLYDPRKTRVEGAKMRIGFTHVESGLRTRKGSLEDFVIAGEDQDFIKARAEIDGDTVVVWADSIAHPKAVRYDWDDWTGATLMNKDGLPASPFRTDDWPIREPLAPKNTSSVGSPQE
jgi:sialate O-acetylesterase